MFGGSTGLSSGPVRIIVGMSSEPIMVGDTSVGSTIGEGAGEIIMGAGVLGLAGGGVVSIAQVLASKSAQAMFGNVSSVTSTRATNSHSSSTVNSTSLPCPKLSKVAGSSLPYETTKPFPIALLLKKQFD